MSKFLKVLLVYFICTTIVGCSNTSYVVFNCTDYNGNYEQVKAYINKDTEIWTYNGNEYDNDLFGKMLVKMAQDTGKLQCFVNTD